MQNIKPHEESVSPPPAYLLRSNSLPGELASGRIDSTTNFARILRRGKPSQSYVIVKALGAATAAATTADRSITHRVERLERNCPAARLHCSCARSMSSRTGALLRNDRLGRRAGNHGERTTTTAATTTEGRAEAGRGFRFPSQNYPSFIILIVMLCRCVALG